MTWHLGQFTATNVSYTGRDIQITSFLVVKHQIMHLYIIVANLKGKINAQICYQELDTIFICRMCKGH